MPGHQLPLENVAISKYLNKRLTIFLFHEIGVKPSKFHEKAGTFMHVEKFEELVDWISRSFSVESMNSLISGQELGKRPCILTFDDTWKGALTLASELLARRKLPATYFLNSSILDGYPDLAAHAHLIHPEKQWPTARVGDELSSTFTKTKVEAFSGETGIWDDVKNLDPHLFTLGNHLYWHSDVSTGSPDNFRTNFTKNTEGLKEFPNFRQVLAFPYGRENKHFTPTHIKIAGSLGAEKSFSSNSGSNRNAKHFLLRRTAPVFQNSPQEILQQVIKADFRRQAQSLSKPNNK